MKRNKRGFIKLICASLIAYNLTATVNGKEYKDNQSNEKNISIVENAVQDYIERVEKSAVPGSLIAVGNLEYSDGYKFIDRVLYDDNDEVVDLTNDSRYLYFTGANIDKETLELMNLRKSNTKAIILSSSSITNDCISSLPSSLFLLSLNRCNYLTDLSELPTYCPNLQTLNLNNTNIDNFDFIYDLPNLRVLNASESLGVTEELISYLNANNIETNITRDDIELKETLVEIKNSITTDDMSEKEKVHAICLYVLDHMQYDINLMDDSNDNPIGFALSQEKGVCISYSYLTDALLTLAGIETYKIDNMSHAWNIIKVDGNYYYIDTTAMDSKSDLRYTTTTVDSNLTIIPSSLKEDIISGSTNDQKHNYSVNSKMFNLMLFCSLTNVVVSLDASISIKNVCNSCKKLVLFNK